MGGDRLRARAGHGHLGIPQVLATGVTMQIATRLADRVPPGRIVVLGTILA